ncbi:phosphopantothenate--cysteine ligase [Streptococcus macacae]|uniref:Phosphopantothenate--cysteine ligase n=1 Tax=Streptococcus macacae NCTC 11558 TaxID=764298 RepID=G5JUC5_9STRE|nr:phosphopantothenate--cysteine ligase [Streptococcus macacae]EHJ52295.1 phosphopantothenate--cysteine ligase [Streptococcus macacae NCTC 11558]SUN78488.1 phosphopantothenate--cysteine ligase [Streptococcus macacae NCTC 11558]
MKILITSGGTSESIDSVRSITNHSTGRLGKKMADLFLNKGDHVTLVTTAAAVKPNKHKNLSILEVTNVESLIETLEPLVKEHDIFIHSMAVSDYTPVYMTDVKTLEHTKNMETLLHHKNTESKISSKADYQVLFLKKTPKVISLVKKWNPNITLIGFKLLVKTNKEELLNTARESLHNNQADYVLANDLAQISHDKHIAYLLDKHHVFKAQTKSEIAQLIFEKVRTNHD